MRKPFDIGDIVALAFPASSLIAAALRRSFWIGLLFVGGAANVHGQALTFPSACSSCHGSAAPPSIAASSSGGSTFGLNEGWMDSSDSLRSRVKEAGAGMLGREAMTDISESNAESVWNYLVALRDAVVSTPSPSFSSTAVGSTSDGSFSFTIDNRRDHALTYTLSIPGADFAVTSHTASGTGCSAGNVPASTDTSPRTCTVNVTVQFAPKAAGSLSADLAVDLSSGVNSPQPLDRSFALSGEGLMPILLSVVNLDISAVVGSPTTKEILITNQSPSAVTLSSFDFSGAYASEFTRHPSSTCRAGLPVAATSSCTLVVQFAPISATPASRGATVAIAHGAFGSPQSVALQGTATPAPQGVLEATVSSVAFPNTQLGGSASRSVTLRNVGTAVLTFSEFATGGTHASDFERSGDCATSSPLDVDATCTLTITFRPAALDARSGSLTIAHNGSNPSAVISLAGTGIPVPVPVASFDPASGLAFGAQTVGGLYPPRTLRVSNGGTAEMTVASVVVQGSAFSDATAAACPATLAPGEGCDVQVRFSAAEAGTGYSGSVRISTNAAGSPHVLPLSGSGTAAAVPVLAWTDDAGTFDFGTVSVGSISSAQSLTLRNVGPGGVTLSLLNAVGADAGMFSVSGDASDVSACRAGSVLFEGETCRVDIRFAPGANGARTAKLQVVSSGSPPPPIALAGTGSSGPLPGMTLEPTVLELETARVGSTSLPGEITIESSGGAAMTVQSMSASGPFRVERKSCPAVPFTLASGAACTVSVTFVPQSEGAANGALTVISDADPTGKEVALSAEAEPRAEDGGGGGCTLSQGRSPVDPVLWLLVLLAAAALHARRRRARGSATFGQNQP